jgi:hypothetical protein
MKYMFIHHCIDPAAEHGTDGMPAFDSWLGTIEVRPVNDQRCGNPGDPGEPG